MGLKLGGLTVNLTSTRFTPMVVRGVLTGWTGSLRMSGGGLRALGGLGGGQSGSMAGVQAQTPARQLASARVEGGRIIVEREVELETIWDIRRIALDSRVYILYAYAQKYLGYNGSLGEFVSDCTILFFKEKGVEVALKLPEAT
jgi:hypothetical protein